jgi:hypothetical protein
MTDVHSIADDQVRSAFKRWQNLEEEKARVADDLKVVLARIEYCPESGKIMWIDPGAEAFESKKARRVFLALRDGKTAGCIHSSGYVRIFCDGKSYQAHRLIWALMHGVDPDCDIDHINGNRADNRLINLRLATRLLAQGNRQVVC